MPTKFSLSGILFIMFMSSCSDSSEDFTVYSTQNFVNKWAHTYKEGCYNSRSMVFMPELTTDLTNWRFRNRLEMLADGSVTYTIVDIKDPHWKGEPRIVTGTWTYDPDAETLLILSTDEQVLFSFSIIWAMKDKLTIGYIESVDRSLPK